MFKVDCVTAQKTDTLAQAINDRITTLVGSGYITRSTADGLYVSKTDGT